MQLPLQLYTDAVTAPTIDAATNAATAQDTDPNTAPASPPPATALFSYFLMPVLGPFFTLPQLMQKTLSTFCNSIMIT